MIFSDHRSRSILLLSLFMDLHLDNSLNPSHISLQKTISVIISFPSNISFSEPGSPLAMKMVLKRLYYVIVSELGGDNGDKWVK